jgi:hypothetical protein
MTPEEAENFYEDDEPVAEVLAAFDRGVKGVTARPDGYEALAADPEVQAEAEERQRRVCVLFHPDAMGDVHFYASMDDLPPAQWVEKVVREEIGRRITAEIEADPLAVAQIREARAEIRRGETVDLGSFAQHAEED